MTAHWPTLSPRIRREALVEWCARPEFTHALSLAPNRKNISPELLLQMFGTFCREVDRFMLGGKHIHRRFTNERFHALAFPEMLDGNPHLHCVANFARTHWQHRLDKPWPDELPNIWRRVTRGSGQIFLREKDDAGWGRYITKEAYRPGHDFFLAADFHSLDRLNDRRLEAILASLK